MNVVTPLKDLDDLISRLDDRIPQLKAPRVDATAVHKRNATTAARGVLPTIPLIRLPSSDPSSILPVNEDLGIFILKTLPEFNHH
jgi:hypothetical protein